ncbi:MAG: hypothetical protein JJ863_19220 [Deltaproteobacteria bacterium]|nr:hypothetical protein [Deltaproteobacteria bacterium]
MAIASLCLGGASFFFMIAGMLFTMVPVVGAVLSIGAPVLALFGVVTGGIAMSRANQMGESSGAATAGLAVSIVGFLVSLLFALTCGLCNACVSTAMMDPNNTTNNGNGPVFTWGGQCQGPNCPPNTNTTSPTQPPFQPPPVANPPAPPPLPTSFAPDSTCDDVRPCCLAFTHDDPTICDGVIAEARQQLDPASACRDLASGWASGLEQLGEPVPASCRP